MRICHWHWTQVLFGELYEVDKYLPVDTRPSAATLVFCYDAKGPGFAASIGPLRRDKAVWTNVNARRGPIEETCL